MPQPTKGPRLGGSPAHQKLMLRNLATALFQHGRITTTEAKARRLRPFAERLITKAKVGDLHNRREIMRSIRDKSVVHRLCTDIGPFFADRNGGYTRITKTMPRKGDNAPMAVIELIQQKTVTDEANRARRTAGSQRTEATPAVGAAATGAAATAAIEAEGAEAHAAAEEAEARLAEDTDSEVASETASEAAEAAGDAAEAALDAAVEAEQEAPGSEAADRAVDAAAAAEEAADAAEDAADEKDADEKDTDEKGSKES